MHSPSSGYRSAQRSAPLTDGSATVQDAARAHGLHNSMTPTAAKEVSAADQHNSACASHGLPSASRRLSNGHASHSSRDHMQRQRERSQERSRHSSSRDRSVDHRGKQSTGRGRRADSPYSPSKAASKPRRRSNSRDNSPGEKGSASQVASILQLLSAVTLHSIRKCVARPMPLFTLTMHAESRGRPLKPHSLLNPKCLEAGQIKCRVCHTLCWPPIHNHIWACAMLSFITTCRAPFSYLRPALWDPTKMMRNAHSCTNVADARPSSLFFLAAHSVIKRSYSDLYTSGSLKLDVESEPMDHANLP